MNQQTLHTIELNTKERKLLEFALIELSKSIANKDGKNYPTLRRIARVLEKSKLATRREQK